jgi:hypothetical protein
LLLFFLHLFDLVLEDFNVEFQLLFDFDVVPDFKLILLQLLLAEGRWELHWLQGRWEGTLEVV